MCSFCNTSYTQYKVVLKPPLTKNGPEVKTRTRFSKSALFMVISGLCSFCIMFPVFMSRVDRVSSIVVPGCCLLSVTLVWRESWSVCALSYSAVVNIQSDPCLLRRGQVCETSESRGLFHGRDPLCRSLLLSDLWIRCWIASREWSTSTAHIFLWSRRNQSSKKMVWICVMEVMLFTYYYSNECRNELEHWINFVEFFSSRYASSSIDSIDPVQAIRDPSFREDEVYRFNFAILVHGRQKSVTSLE